LPVQLRQDGDHQIGLVGADHAARSSAGSVGAAKATHALKTSGRN
jgi:hypothetical protein